MKAGQQMILLLIVQPQIIVPDLKKMENECVPSFGKFMFW